MDDQLSHRIQTLPQELQDKILINTIPIESHQEIIINNNFVAPWQLQLNQTSRRELAPIYFGTNTFVAHLPITISPITDGTHMADWIRAQSMAHRNMITKIKGRVLDTYLHDDLMRASLLQSFKESLPLIDNAVITLARAGNDMSWGDIPWRWQRNISCEF